MCNNMIPPMINNNMIPQSMLAQMIAMQDINGIPFNNMNYNTDNNDITTRLNALERQVKRMQDRILKLEASNNNYNNEDNSIYMM